MENNNNNLKTTKSLNEYDDNNIPKEDLPKTSSSKDVIPDEVPRHDGPGGE